MTLKTSKDIFPNNPVTNLGTYEYLTQTITLNSVTPVLHRLAFEARDPSARFRVIPVFAHEVAHWHDHTSTVWGQDLLVQTFNAFNTRAENDQYNFHQILDLERTINRIRFPEYYSTLEDGALEEWDNVPWLYQFTCGIMFSREGKPSPDHPIVFTRFANHRGQNICRVPFSTTTLLEVNAVSVELAEAFRAIDELNENEARHEEERSLLVRKVLDQLYDPVFAVYSAAAHCFANRVTTLDAFTAYTKAARVARLCLNLPSALFPQIKSPAICEAMWGDRVSRLRDLRDRGYLYFCLIENGRAFDHEDIDQWIERALQASGLPPAREIMALAREELNSLKQGAKDGPARQRLEELLDYGLKCFDRFGLDVDRSLYDGGELMPPVKLRGDIFAPGGPGMRIGTFADPESWENEANRYGNQLREFVEACLL